MGKLDELRNLVAETFKEVTDADMIKRVGALDQKINEIEQADKEKDQKYEGLLKDYKDVVLHSSFKPTDGQQIQNGPTSEPVSFESFLNNWKDKN